MLEPLSAIVQAIRMALEASPPELSADISERGIVLTGGGAQLEGITEYAKVIFSSNVRIGKPLNYLNLEKKFSNPCY